MVRNISLFTDYSVDENEMKIMGNKKRLPGYLREEPHQLRQRLVGPLPPFLLLPLLKYGEGKGEEKESGRGSTY